MKPVVSILKKVFSSFFHPLLCLGFSQCNTTNTIEPKQDQKKLYYWEPTACSPEKHPVELIDVSYFFDDGSSLSVFDSFAGSGIGIAACGADYGKNWSIALPVEVSAKWISYTEKKTYILYDSLPIDQLNYLFENGYEAFDREGNSIKGNFRTLSLCLLPGGDVFIYVNADSRRLLLDWSVKAECSNDYELFREEGDDSKSLEEHINTTIKLNPEFNISQVLSIDLIYKYLERFNYQIKVDFEDDNSNVTWFRYEYSNSELSIACYRDLEKSIKNPSRMKYFRVNWNSKGYTYSSYFYFNEEEVIRLFDEAYGMDRTQNGEFKIHVGKDNNLFDLSLTVNDKKYTFEKTEIRVFKTPLSDPNSESELVYKNYEGDHANIFTCQ